MACTAASEIALLVMARLSSCESAVNDSTIASLSMRQFCTASLRRLATPPRAARSAAVTAAPSWIETSTSRPASSRR